MSVYQSLQAVAMDAMQSSMEDSAHTAESTCGRIDIIARLERSQNGIIPSPRTKKAHEAPAFVMSVPLGLPFRHSPSSSVSAWAFARSR